MHEEEVETEGGCEFVNVAEALLILVGGGGVMVEVEGKQSLVAGSGHMLDVGP